MTPVELTSYKFKKGMRGYNVEEVDNLLQNIYRDYEALYRETQEQNDRIAQLKEMLAKYEELENTLNDTLLTAQKAAEETKKNADKEAELILKEAGANAENIVRQAEEEARKHEQRLEEIKKEQHIFVSRAKSLLQSQLDLLESGYNDINEPENMSGQDSNEERDGSGEQA